MEAIVFYTLYIFYFIFFSIEKLIINTVSILNPYKFNTNINNIIQLVKSN